MQPGTLPCQTASSPLRDLSQHTAWLGAWQLLAVLSPTWMLAAMERICWHSHSSWWDRSRWWGARCWRLSPGSGKAALTSSTSASVSAFSSCRQQREEE